MAELATGVNELLHGANVLVHGAFGGFTPRVEPNHAIVHLTVDFVEFDGVSLHLWTGPGDLVHDGVRYINIPYHLIGVSDLDQTYGVDDRSRVSVSMAVPPAISGAVGGQELDKRVDIKVQPVYSIDGGLTWHWINQVVEGIMSDGEVVQSPSPAAKLFNCELATLDSDVDRGFTSYYSTTSQETKGFPSDRGLEHLEVLADGKRTERWPQLVVDT